MTEHEPSHREDLTDDEKSDLAELVSLDTAESADEIAPVVDLDTFRARKRVAEIDEDEDSEEVDSTSVQTITRPDGIREIATLDAHTIKAVETTLDEINEFLEDPEVGIERFAGHRVTGFDVMDLSRYQQLIKAKLGCPDQPAHIKELEADSSQRFRTEGLELKYYPSSEAPNIALIEEYITSGDEVGLDAISIIMAKDPHEKLFKGLFKKTPTLNAIRAWVSTRKNDKEEELAKKA